MSHLSLQQLSLSYTHGRQENSVFRNLSLEVTDGELCVLMGPSGCGKSSLLQLLAGVRKPGSGSVLIDGTSPDPRKHSIGYVPQHYGLLPWKSVKDNLFLPLRFHRTRMREVNEQEILDTLELNDLLHRYPHQLSGGQQQRVALARSFIQQPELLLLDEPFAALDALTAERSRALFRRIWEQHRVTTLLVTHSVEEAAALGQRVCLFGFHPGDSLISLSQPTVNELRQQINKMWL